MNLPFMNNRNLYRDIILSCWLIIGIYALGTSVQLFFTDYEPMLFFRKAILFPILKMAALNAAMGWIFRKERSWANYLLIIGVNLFTCVIIVSLYELPIVIYSLIIPILLSLYFYSRRLIVFALIQALLTVVVIYAFAPTVREGLHSDNLIMLLSLLTATTLIINKLRKHAFALFHELVKVTEEKQDLQTKNTYMEKLNRMDPATGLYNHRSFHEHLVNVMNLPEAHSLQVHLAVLDIDNFKRVNDTFGHAAGDVVIQFVAGQLSASLDPNDFVSRYGGEEFAVLCVEKNTGRVVEQLEEIRRSISLQHHEVLDGEAVTISIGVRKLMPGMSKEELFHQADTALYHAKRSGKNRTIIADDQELRDPD